MTRDELIELLRRLLDVPPEDEGGCCRHCYAWTAVDVADPHKPDCPYAQAIAILAARP